MRILSATVRCLDTLSELLGRTAAIFAPVMVLVTCYIVISRYVFDSGSVAVQELITYCNALLFSLGAGYTLKQNAHVRVDIFFSKAQERTQALINLLGTLLLLLPVTLFILVVCWQYVVNAWIIKEGSGDAGGLPFIYLLKTLILVLGATLILQGVAEALRNLLFLCGPGRFTVSKSEEAPLP